MSVGQVFDVDIVADAGAVGGRVVRAEHRQRRGPLGGAQDVRDEVRFRLVLLAVVLGRARHIEIAEADAAQPIGRRIPAQGALEGAFRLAIGVDRDERGMLLDRDRGRDAVDGGARREHDPRHAGLAGSFEQGDAAGHVIAVVPGWVRDRLADQRAGRAMQDRLDPISLEQLAQRVPLRIRPDSQLGARHERRPVAGTELIEDAHLVARRQQSLHADRTDVARSTGYKDPQRRTSAAQAYYHRQC